MTPAELGRRLSAAEMVEYQALWRIAPWGEPRADLRAGVLAALTANLHRDPKKPPLTPEDLMPYLKPPAPAVPLAKRLRTAFSAMVRPTGGKR